jgi:hypothetical protein
MARGNGSRPEFASEEMPTDRPVIKTLHDHSTRLGDQAEQIGMLMAAVEDVRTEQARQGKKLDRLLKPNARQLATTAGVGLVAGAQLIHELLRALGKSP